MTEIAAPVLVDRVFDDLGLVPGLIARHGPYWNQAARYLPPSQPAASATAPSGHPWAMDGGLPPLFRADWHEWHSPAATAPGVEPLLASPVLEEAARRLFGGVAAVPAYLLVNITAPMPRTDAGHVDVPYFRGLDRRHLPGWFLLAMQRSGLFTRWSVRTATAVTWFYEGAGGGLTYWPQGPAGAAQTVPAASNTAIVGDNDRMPHRVEAVGEPGRWRAVPPGADLHHAGGDAWELRDGDTVAGAYHRAELRISLSWKAEVFLDAADRERRAAHLDDLTVARALAIMADALRERGHWAGEAPADASDPRWTQAVMAAFPRQPPPQLQLRSLPSPRGPRRSGARSDGGTNSLLSVLSGFKVRIGVSCGMPAGGANVRRCWASACRVTPSWDARPRPRRCVRRGSR